MRLKMMCSITKRNDGRFVALLDIFDINGDEYMEPFIKVCANRKEAIAELGEVLRGDNNHYKQSRMKFKRTDHYMLGEDEIFEYMGEYTR